MSNGIVSLDISLAMLQEKKLPDLSAIELHWQHMKDLLHPQKKKQRWQWATGIYAAIIMLTLLSIAASI